MAKKEGPSNAGSEVNTSTFNKGLTKDYDEVFFPEGAWSHARNAVNNTNEGQLGTLSTEQATLLCASAPYTVIGAVYMHDTTWGIFSTDNIHSEVGLFDTAKCGDTDAYIKVVNDDCLSFSQSNLITGAAKLNFDCSWQLYWSDGLNPDRSLNVDNVPYIQNCTTIDSCIICTPTNQLDCDAIRLISHAHSPCMSMDIGTTGGTLLNGSYFVVIAYTINGVKATDYFSPSNVVAVFNHDNLQGSLDITFSNLDQDNYDEFELVVVRMVAANSSAKRFGTYSTRTKYVSIDNLEESLPSIPLALIPYRNFPYEKSDTMSASSEYLFRIAPTGRFDFNYQPLANQISTQWVMTEYPHTYYEKAGTNVGYMRDEQYAFWIRWVYDTGETSSSYHIPGRARRPNIEFNPATGQDYIANNIDAIEAADPLEPYIPKRWEVYNTATFTPTNYTLPDGGVVVAQGDMGFWESSEIYPDNKPNIWNATYVDPTTGVNIGGTTNSFDYDLCGKPIRHHKMPADLLNTFNGPLQSNAVINDSYTHVRTDSSGKAQYIRLLGVTFDNIKPPVDNYGNIIPSIVGYEILRGTRVGNKTVLAKGIINNMRTYKLQSVSDVDGSSEPTTIGLFQNYPYNPLYVDPAIVNDETNGGVNDTNEIYFYGPGVTTSASDIKFYSQNLFTFHSPETNFRNPYLSPTELKIYTEISQNSDEFGYNVRGKFRPVPGHPRHKLVTDLAFIVACLTGIAEAIVVHIAGKKKESVEGTASLNAYNSGLIGALQSATIVPLNIAGSSFLNLASASVGGPQLDSPMNMAIAYLASEVAQVAGYQGTRYKKENENTDLQSLPKFLRIATGLVLTAQYFSQGMNVAMDLIKALVKYRQYAWRYLSHGNLHRHWKGNAIYGNTRRYIDKSMYLDPSVQNFFTDNGTYYKINNLNRIRTVALHVTAAVNNPNIADNTAQTIGSHFGSDVASPSWDHDNSPLPEFGTSASCFYAGLKVRLINQYGQLNGVRQIPIPCKIIVNNNTPLTNTNTRFTSPVLFGGDTYVGRYTEKNTFFYFRDWLYNVPDGTEFNYANYYMLGFPRYWADFTEFEVSGFISSVFQNLIQPDEWELPSNLHHLDRGVGGNPFGGISEIQGGNGIESPDIANASSTTTGEWVENPAYWDNGFGPPGFGCGGCDPYIWEETTSTSITVDQAAIDDAADPENMGGFGSGFNAANFVFGLKDAYMYLFNSSVRDFYVESEINLACRDWDNEPARRHYDEYTYTDLAQMFDTQIIKFGNYYKYDYSLGVSYLMSNFNSWGQMQFPYYNPAVSASCFTYMPNRIIYSLPFKNDAPKDTWNIFLAMNYVDYANRPLMIKPVNKTGFAVLFKDASPLLYAGQDVLQTELNTKIILGDGGLFSTDPQSISNTENAFQYGACQNKWSVTTTPFGLYWMSQSQGKIFAYGEGLEEISNAGLKWWFAYYLPYRLLQDFPTFTLTDNPVIGIGCQTIFDNQDQVVYFCKKDYKLREDAPYPITYISDNIFHPVINGKAAASNIYLGDPLYFEDASWTVSYDPKQKYWVSFHDWHPDLTMSAPIDFYSTKGKDIWRHNYRWDLYCNFYGLDYSFEVEYIAQTGQIVNTTRSLEYMLECYKVAANGIDQFHILDGNFDQAVVFNTEQVSGLLNLFIKPKNDPFAMISYPIINFNSIDIIFSKEENKYRFNQFWDITNDRGEYQVGGVLVQQPIWDTQENGYIRTLNANNMNYQKPPLQRKKFRHYSNHILLIKQAPKEMLMTLKIANNKLLYSPR